MDHGDDSFEDAIVVIAGLRRVRFNMILLTLLIFPPVTQVLTEEDVPLARLGELHSPLQQLGER